MTEKRWALKLVEDYVPSPIADKGGEANVTYADDAAVGLRGTP